MMTLQEEALYSDLNVKIESVTDQLKLWTRYDTIWCLESTGEKKEGSLTKVIETIKSIIKEAKELITKGINYLTNHIRYGLLSPRKKAEYKRFLEFAEKNPEVKNKKVTVKDWQRITREYDKVEKNIVKMMADDKVDANGLNLKANEMIKNLSSLANSATAAVTVDVCMVLARKSPEMAQMVQKALNNCSVVLDNIEDQLGSREATKLQKNVAKLTKESTGQRWLAHLYTKKEKSITDCINEVTDTLTKLMSGEANTTDKIKAAVEHRDLIRTGTKAYIKDERTRKGVKTVLDGKKKLDSNETAQSVISTVKEFIKPTV